MATTKIDERLRTEFKLRNWPGKYFRLHPSWESLICNDGEVVIQVERDGEWLDFARSQQSEVLSYFQENTMVFRILDATENLSAAERDQVIDALKKL